MSGATKPVSGTSGAPAAPRSEEISSLLGHGSEFSGKLTFEGAVRIDGRFSGEITADGLLVVGAEAEVTADLAVRHLVIQGRVEGSCTATELVELHAPARVKGKIVTPQLSIERGVRFDGSCEMSGAETGGKPAVS
jgi:cytoskeletal protein CcmA (bactofilin family)